PAARERAARLVEAAIAGGARPVLPWRAPAPDEERFPPAVLADAAAGMALLDEDVFVPVLALVPVATTDEALALNARCPYALGASVFGPADAATALARRIRAGAVTVNDLIAPTADPRLPFGGFGRSGFGRTRGGEGLVEMTAAKVVTLRHGRFRPHYDGVGAEEASLLRAFVAVVHEAGRRRARAALDLARGLVRLARRGRSNAAGDRTGDRAG
ncbi:MAG: aldehyde dehydrogenase family protein, partial [Alphaproteobacteria bacterium]|nr:aldehyde dehydrogenase family protein [Alphaproteobacteria bacterium]